MSFPHDILFDYLGRNAANQRIFGDIRGDHRASSDDRSTPDSHAFKDGGIQTDPYVTFDHDRRRDNGVAIDRVIVAIADGDPARDGDPMTNRDGGKAVDGGIVVDVTTAQGKHRPFINCQMEAGQDIKMALHRNTRILGQLELRRKIPQPLPLAPQFKLTFPRECGRRCGENAHIRENGNTTGLFSESKQGGTGPRPYVPLEADIQKVFHKHAIWQKVGRNI